MRIIVPLAGLALLAACDSGKSVEMTNATPEEVAAKVKESGLADTMRQPGKWAYNVSITDFQAPGAPPGAAEQLKAMMGSGRAMERCVTAEEIQKIDAFVGENAPGCRYDHYKMDSGSVEGEARCEANGMKQHMVIKAKYDQTTSDTTLTTNVSGGPSGAIKMTMNIKAQRIGECDGAAPKTAG